MMNLEQLFCEYAETAANKQADMTDHMLYRGFIAMYKKTGELKYFKLVKEYVDRQLSAAPADLLAFLYQDTHEEAYRIQLEAIIQYLVNSKVNENGIYVKEDGSFYCAEELYEIFPAFVWYDTNFNKKGNYLIIMKQLQFITSHLLDDGKTDSLSKQYLMMMLAETVNGMSEEIYEHYAKVKSWLKKSVHSNLELKDSNPAMMSYILFAGCKNKTLLAEKYENRAKELFDEASNRFLLNGTNAVNYADAGALMMAYAFIETK